jgi:hypothetical protein
MRLPLCCGLALLATAALAQAPAGTQERDASPRQRQRAPLANVDDLEPAVDVGAPRVAAARPSEPAAAPPAPAPAANPPASPQAASQAPRPRVMDSLDLGTTSITGNQELPKVLYIVPWKKSDLGDLVGRPVNTLLDEVLAPIDPDVFQRNLEYYETLHGGSEKE